MDDQKLLQLLFCRDDTAITGLTQRFGDRLFRTACNILHSPEDAQEAVNDTYLAIWNAIPPEKPDPLEGYVYRTGRNISLKKLRYQSAQKRSNPADVSLEELAGCIPGGDLDQDLDTRALGQAIDRFLDQLNRLNRVLFLRRYWFGDDLDTLSKTLGLTHTNLSVRLHRIRVKLKAYLEKEGFRP